ncbi:glycosyltransferase [Puteibacter caeruleilacunae]|nr:glycosyltransferase [Puteibacter caeruleilacunae]
MISLVVPIFNEEDLIDELLRRVVNALEQTNVPFEVITVDDGSKDTSLNKLLQWHQNDRRIKVLTLSRNFGHQAAYTAGIDYAEGDYIAMMDGDLQDPPELLPQMYNMLCSGEYDIICGLRTDRKETGIRKLLIKGFHRVFRTGSGSVANTGNFSMLNKKATDAFRDLKEKTRYLPGLRNFIGFKQGNIEYERDERWAGTPKMSIFKLFTLAADAIFSFSKFPIKFCLYIGLLGIIISFAAGLYILFSKLLGLAPLGWSSTMTSIFFLGSIQLTFLGVLGEYVFRIYKESQNRPIYIIKDFYS